MKCTFDQLELNGFYRYCVALTGDGQSAWDLLQDCLEKWVQKDRRNIRNPKGYFLRMLHNRMIDNSRRSALRDEQPYDDGTVVQMTAMSLDDIVAGRQEVTAIMKILTPEERELLFLWAVAEYTAREMAEYLEMPRGTILSRLHRLRAKIKTKLAKSRSRHAKKLQKTY